MKNISSDIFPVKSILIGGENISSFKIVISSSASDEEAQASQILSKYVKLASGAELDILTDSEHADYEIVIGNTSRENERAAIRRGNLKNDGISVFFEKPSKLFIIGCGKYGIIHAVYHLLETIGWRFYDEENERILPCDKISIPDDFDYSYSPPLMYRKTDWQLSVDQQHKLGLNGELSIENSIVGFAHTIGRLSETGDRGQPCLSDEKIYQTVLKNVRKTIEDHPGCRVISVTQNDNFDYCRCPKCTELAERENQSGVFISFVNRLAAEIEKEHPEVYLLTFAYQYTRKAPTTIRPAKNVIIWLCSIECCFSHSLDNPDCSENAAFAKDIREWAQIADNLYIWDYVTNYRHYITPFPNFKTLLPNARFFTEHNAIGIYEEGDYQQKENGEFRSLRAYLIGKILWDPYMSEEEYYSLMDDFLEGYYGSGWKYVREYIDRTCERASDKFLGIYVSPQTPFSDATGNIDIDFCTEMYSLWQKAYDVAENDKLKYNCRRSMVQMKFIMLIARSIKNGCIYPEENRALALEMKDIGIIYHRESWTMARGTTESLDEKALTELAPHQWE
ncbi:MAG: DUF4838 domain-containing protein [Clostridia bacterium]|nr:DUF4838 domain-containing protein [Clostridia bacterium]